MYWAGATTHPHRQPRDGPQPAGGDRHLSFLSPPAGVVYDALCRALFCSAATG